MIRHNRILIFLAILSAAVVWTGCNEHPTHESSPILIVASQENFGFYTAEILKTEGFNSFRTIAPGSAGLTADYLKGFDIVILGQQTVGTDELEILKEYVDQGGNLIAFRPDKNLEQLFGISASGGSVSEAYLSVDVNTAIGRGLRKETMQFHGMADKYVLSEAEAIAWISEDGKANTKFPAVVKNVFGNGQAVAFLYNLPGSIVLTRQGNYRDAGKEMDGILGIRAMDLFTGGWVDNSKNTLNQADEQMRLLTHCIEQLSADKRPIPRFWYFPDSLKCLVTLNNDGEDSKEKEFVKQFEDVDAKKAKMTLYIKEVEFISKAWVDQWRQRGFEISGHPDDTRQAANPDWNTMDSVYKALLQELKTSYGIPSMETVTNHWFVWVGHNRDGDPDFAAQAKIEAANGVGLDCNYAHYDNGSPHGHFLGAFGTEQGNYTGSGLAMKFADVNGEIIDIYQQLNNVYDQQYMEHKDQDGYFNAFRGLMDRSLYEEVYSTISVRAHNNEYFFSEIPLMKMLDYATEKGIPVWTELQLLEFLRVKDEASFEDLSWKDHTLTFTIKSSLKHERGISCLIPASSAGRKIDQVLLDGSEQPFHVGAIKGTDYAWLLVQPGSNCEVKVNYR